MEKRDLKVSDVVQLNPDTVRNKAFAGCMMVVTEPLNWGAQGYVQGIGDRAKCGGQYHYRATWEEMEYVGIAMWIRD
jgi:hypothetical protein